MPPNERDPQVRQDGWYWVRWAEISTWEAYEWQDDEWLEERDYLPFKVGPRIPSPDEQPAPAISERPEGLKPQTMALIRRDERIAALEAEVRELRADQERSTMRLVCARCKAPVVFRSTEGCYRHAEPDHRIICDRYGYPIEVEPESIDAARKVTGQ